MLHMRMTLGELVNWLKSVTGYILFGYFPEPTKSWLIVKENHKTKAEEIFSHINIKITTEGKKYLGGFIVNLQAHSKYANILVEKWVAEIILYQRLHGPNRK